jgi:hypothetical protein
VVVFSKEAKYKLVRERLGGNLESLVYNLLF